jgi:hypothetical protein
MLSVGLLPIVCPRIHYVDIDLHWSWFVVVTITGQLFTEFLNLQLPTFDFNLLQALREFAIGQAKALHNSFKHALAADCCDFDAIFADLYTGVSESRSCREFARIGEIRLANAVAIAAWAFWIGLSGVVVTVTAGIFRFTSVTLNSLESFLFKLNCIPPLVVVTEAPAVTTRTAAILRKLVCVEGGELPHLREDFIGTAKRARNRGLLLLRNGLRDPSFP